MSQTDPALRSRETPLRRPRFAKWLGILHRKPKPSPFERLTPAEQHEFACITAQFFTPGYGNTPLPPELRARYDQLSEKLNGR